MLYILTIILFFTITGYLTILERGILGLVHNRKGVSKINTFNIYHFYLDFLKMIIKGRCGKTISKFNNLIILILGMLTLILFIFFLLPFNAISKNITLSFIWLIVLDNILLIYKIFLLERIGGKIVKLTSKRIRKIYIILEGCMNLLYSPIIYIYILFSSSSWGISQILLGKLSIIYLTPLYLTLLMVNLLKSLRCPFDYFEVESELSGGGTLEFGGINFVIWSLVEYSLIQNNIYILITIILIIWGFINYSIIITLFIILSILIMLTRGVLTRVRFESIFMILIKIQIILIVLSLGEIIIL
ncbi:NADH dehydrogenase subunit 1 (mitochondrion) [Myxobolus squamalis]|uniref:NADH dehydrogenase subunit 1 n=1 Tax=Myxobolus squamalis TaxID=59785 RepID=A0A678XDF9_MYXSQ|nr:NADH dehydrogenase subunit 1 [Myxobolus squamalis]